MHTITRTFSFDMGHRITHSRCFNPHGHTYQLEVTVADELDEYGMVMDFGELKKRVNELVVDGLDHCFICYSRDTVLRTFLEENDFKRTLVDFGTTAENLVEWIYHRLAEGGLKVTHVRLYETQNSRADYIPKAPLEGAGTGKDRAAGGRSKDSSTAVHSNEHLPAGGD